MTKKFTIEISHASTGQLQTIALELKIMANGWKRHGPRITINNKKLQALQTLAPGRNFFIVSKLDSSSGIL